RRVDEVAALEPDARDLGLDARLEERVLERDELERHAEVSHRVARALSGEGHAAEREEEAGALHVVGTERVERLAEHTVGPREIARREERLAELVAERDARRLHHELGRLEERAPRHLE